jgi:hypothetical protein
MARPEILPFDDSHLPAAGLLLAERHRRHRVAQPFLPKRFEDPDAALAEVTAVWRSDDSSGAVALLAGQVVGYLLGAPKSNSVWGPNVWVEAAGQAVRTAEDMRDLYGFAAARWAEEGRTAHYVLTPAQDAALLHAWFRLAFGQQHSHGIRGVPLRPAPPAPHVTVRAAARDDIPTLARLEAVLPAHQGLSPTFSAGERGSYEQSLQERRRTSTTRSSPPSSRRTTGGWSARRWAAGWRSPAPTRGSPGRTTPGSSGSPRSSRTPAGWVRDARSARQCWPGPRNSSTPAW